jgi:hypothetical protein
MKKYIFLIIWSVFFFSGVLTTSANWLPVTEVCNSLNATTVNSGSKTFPKLQWEFKLCIKQELLENPYASGTLQFDGTNYYYTPPAWVMQLVGPTVNQAQFLWNYIVEEKIYKYDTVAPETCSKPLDVYFWTIPATPPLIAYTGGWTNQDLFSRHECKDGLPAITYIVNDKWVTSTVAPPYSVIGNKVYETVSIDYDCSWYEDVYWTDASGNTIIIDSIYHAETCTTTSTDLRPTFSVLTGSTTATSWCQYPNIDTNVTHNTSTVLLAIFDNAGNGASHTCTYSGASLPVLKDAYPPIVSVREEQNTVLLKSITDVNFSTGKVIATENLSFHVKITDKLYGGSAISGIKEYRAQAKYIADYKWTPIPHEVICSVPSTVFPKIIDPTNVYDVEDTKEFDLNCATGPAFTRAGIYLIEVYTLDHAGSERTFQSHVEVLPHPTIRFIEWSAFQWPVNSDGIQAQVYRARMLDKYDNPVINHPISTLNVTGNSTVYENEVTLTKGNPFQILPSSYMSNDEWYIDVSVTSLAPGKLSSGFQVGVREWANPDEYEDNSGVEKLYSFSNPFDVRVFMRWYVGRILVDPVPINLWYPHTATLDISRNSFAPAIYEVFGMESTLSAEDAGLTLSEIAPVSSSATEMSFVPEQQLPEILSYVLQAHPYIKYSIWGKDITAYITTSSSDDAWIFVRSASTGSINRIYVSWNKKSIGKDGLVSSLDTINSRSPIELKNAIKRNAMIAVRSRTPDTSATATPSIVNNIKYIKWDYTITALEAANITWSTLIVIDGNVTLESDLNVANKNIAIIVLNSEFSTTPTLWNIFIKPNVTYVSAILYADGAIKSVDSAWQTFPTMNQDRSDALKKQLVMNGIVISRNTIGGAVLGDVASGGGWKKYTLPGNMGTDDQDLAAQYDLSFLRSGNEGYDLAPMNSRNYWNDAFTVVLYDPKYLFSPPSGFSLSE